ncbi:GH12972 [Drosophila grimshawi]|uniref:GH12972 n=1 Tax=Drosophila grimshawi TaxID=7222 RepID=B4K1R9_DROGR|nr:GH12972 [Drosophila grimshawi]
MSLPTKLDTTDFNGKTRAERRGSQKKNNRSKRSTGSLTKKPKTGAGLPVPKHITQRVFLYMQLKNISNLPVASYPLELHLHHAKNTLQRMSEHYTTETVIYQNEFEMEKPAFALGIIQDNIDEINTFSDNPLVVTLYQRIPRHRKGQLVKVAKLKSEASSFQMDAEKKAKAIPDGNTSTGPEISAADDYMGENEEDEDFIDESVEFLSRGHCDLLQLFQTKRFMSSIPIMLYPEYDHTLETATSQKSSPTSEWHMYSILPILKKLHFTNLVFITLESIYNATGELHERADHLGMSLSIRATRPNLNLDYQVLPLCTFYRFGSKVINEQNRIIVWENIKRDLLGREPLGVANIQMETNLRIPVNQLFRRLLKTPIVDFKLDEIDPLVDKALINNSLHRYVLTAELRQILEAAVVHNDYELLLQLYDEIPTNVLYEGIINPSVFGYPDVNGCRFASVLSSVNRKTRKSFRLSDLSPPPDKPMFAILNLCFFQPLTQRNESLDAYNENHLKVSTLRRCRTMDMLNEQVNSCDIPRELYRNFDEFIKGVISFIIKNDVSTIESKRNYFCCNLGNLRNLLINICGCDFNIRMPTKTNIEFREMLTHMHKELMERIEGLLMDCSWDGLSQCVLHHDNDQERIRLLFEEYRKMCIIGDCVQAKHLFANIKADCTNKMLLNFYTFLNAVESLNFEQASNYLLNQSERNWQAEYFVSLLKLYIDYMMQLKTEELPGVAYSNMIEQLRIFSSNNNLERETWILLYCLYKNNNYLPGMEFTRWRYENLYDVPGKTMPLIPRSMFETFLPQDFDLIDKSIETVKFYATFKMFAQLGAHKFAEIVFDEISPKFSLVESYLIKTILKMLQGEIGESFKVRKFPTGNSVREKMMRYYQAHVNGSVEYSRRRYDDAIRYFKDLMSIGITDTVALAIFHTSLMRLGRLSFESGDYELSKRAFELCVPSAKSEVNFLSNYGMGLALYYLNRLEEAIEYLARSTEVNTFLPDPWGYLATINLRLGRNKTALNCWKIAKMHPEIPLNNRIYIELEKIKYSNVSLLVEDDCKLK